MRRPEHPVEQAHWESAEAPVGRQVVASLVGAGAPSLKALQQAEQRRCPWPCLSGVAPRESLTHFHLHARYHRPARPVEVAVESVEMASR